MKDIEGIISELKYKLQTGEVAVEIGGKSEERLADFLKEVYEWSDKIHLVGRRNLESNIFNSTLDSILMMDFVNRYDKSMGKNITTEVGNSESGVKALNFGGEVLEAGGGGERASQMSRSRISEKNDHLNIADIGSGAGFPGIVWSILNPSARVVLFERRAKIRQFLERMIRILLIENTLIAEEEMGSYLFEKEEEGVTEQELKMEEIGSGVGAPSDLDSLGSGHGFNIVTAKASGRLDEMVPIADSLLAIGGAFVTIKGSRWHKEMEMLDERNRIFLETHRRLLWNRGTVLLLRKR